MAMFNPNELFIELESTDLEKLSFPLDDIETNDKDELLRKRRERQREAMKRHRKRKQEEVEHLRQEAQLLKRENEKLEMKLKLSNSPELNQQIDALASDIKTSERLLERRRHKLQIIWEAWNLGGMDDMRDVAEQVYAIDACLITPDHSDEVKGRDAVMKHWQELFDAFPDGIMEEYNIQEENPDGQKIRVDWIFSGTQVNSFLGVPARNNSIKIKGKSFITFRDTRIQTMVLSWNYREALMMCMGIDHIA